MQVSNSGHIAFIEKQRSSQGQPLEGSPFSAPVHKPIPRGNLAASVQSLSLMDAVKFGCRMMAFATGVQEASASDPIVGLMRSALLSNKNALTQQSLPHRNPRDGQRVPFHVEDLSPVMALGNQQGWGLVAFPGVTFEKQDGTQSVKYFRRADAIATDPTYGQTVRDVLKKPPHILMAHIRVGAENCGGQEVCNNHPFLIKAYDKTWTFMHNGYAPSARKDSPFIQGALSPETLSNLEGQTDSERVFALVMEHLKKTYPESKGSKPTPEQVRQVFAETVRDVIEHNQGLVSTENGEANFGQVFRPVPSSSPLKSLFNLSGEYEGAPATNFVLSDGDSIWAYRRGAKLFLGALLPKSNESVSPSTRRDFILSSEPFRFQSRKADLYWFEIPTDHLVTLTRNLSGVGTPSGVKESLTVQLTPLSKLAPPRYAVSAGK